MDRVQINSKVLLVCPHHRLNFIGTIREESHMLSIRVDLMTMALQK